MTNLAESGNETLALDVTVPESIATLKTRLSNAPAAHLPSLQQCWFYVRKPADPSPVRAMFDPNVFGLFDVVTAFAPLLIVAAVDSSPNSAPTIVNVASVFSRIPLPFAATYNASKAAALAYSDTMRLELVPLDIRVVTVFMGEDSTGIKSVETTNFGPGSIYAAVEDKFKQRVENSAKESMTPDVFAKQIVPRVLANDASYIWKGTNAFIVWLLNAIGSRKAFVSTLTGPVGLSDKGLVRQIYERGQRLVGNA
ncbi:hypothetical protein BDV12DRAFT_195630 [Aspergillus spectabilis]